MKFKTIFVIFLLSNSFYQNVFAYDFTDALTDVGNFFVSAKNAINNQIEQSKKIAQAKADAEALKFSTTNSEYVVQGNANPGAKWIMIAIKMNDKTEQVVFKIDQLGFQKQISLRFGAGKYNLTIFQSNDDGEYTSNYTFVSGFDVVNNDQRDMSYLLPSEMVESDDSRIVDLANQITANSITDLEKVKAIHDYVAENVSYDYDSLVDDKYKSLPLDALSVLEKPITVCEGYATLTAALLRAAHIRTKVIFGKATTADGEQEHGWNEVYIDSTWKSLDVTWDDQPTITYQYFLPDEATFSIDHQKVKVMEDY